MADQSTLNSLTRRIRASLAYAEWVRRNKGPCCLKCGSHDNLQCHHLVDLYHVILGLWKFYGDPEEVFKHAIAMHENDACEGVTLCANCHKIRHPGRSFSISSQQINTSMWTVIPRVHRLDFNHAKIPRKGSIGLVGLQTLLGIGWSIMNGHLESRILSVHRRKFAMLLGKTPGTSFNRSLETALLQLQDATTIYQHHVKGNIVEIHLSKEYLESLKKNPWFVPMQDVPTHSMCVLCLRLFLGMQSRRHNYSIGLDKLMVHLGMRIHHRTLAIRAIERAVKHLSWVKMEVDGTIRFVLSSRPPTPIHSLRAILDDSLAD